MTQMKSPPPGQGSGPLELSFPSGIDLQANSPNVRATQINSRARPRLRLVQATPPPAPRRFITRISVATPFMPVGRSRAFDLTESDIEDLLEAASIMEARRA
jgi:hypothetical protein